MPGPSGTTSAAGQTTDEGKGRIFPCEGCGADLEFHIGQQALKCPYCGYEKEIDFSEEASVEEQDFHAMPARMAEFRAQKAQTEHAGDDARDARRKCAAKVAAGTSCSPARSAVQSARIAGRRF